MQSKPLLAFIKKGLILLIVLFILDRAVGWGLERLFYKQKHGDNFVSIYLLEHAREDIITMGGSRASHHFNASMIEKNTGMTCFNAGRDEMTILYTAAVLNIVYSKYTPKVIIMDMTPRELILAPGTKDVYERVGSVLLPFYNKYHSLGKIISLASPDELIKTRLSAIYAYNSTFGTSIQNAYTNIGHISVKGYEPLEGSIDSASYATTIYKNQETNALDTNAIQALNEVIALAKSHHTRLIVTLSPFYFPIDFYQQNSYLALKKIIKDNNLELYDFTHDSSFLKKPDLFQDDLHLNDKGATIFSQTIIDIINHKPPQNMKIYN